MKRTPEESRALGQDMCLIRLSFFLSFYLSPSSGMSDNCWLAGWLFACCCDTLS
jgi:hypothetical protein